MRLLALALILILIVLSFNSALAQSADSSNSSSLSSSSSSSNSRAASQNKSKKPLVLYGRIEELCSGTGATLPLKLQAMTPIRDASLDKKLSASIVKDSTKKLASQTSLSSYPVDFRGTWSGDLTVFSVNFDKSFFEFDQAEAQKQSQLLKPGIKGQTTVTFYSGNDNKIQLEPCQVIFTTTMAASQYGDSMRQALGANSALSGLFAGSGAGGNIASMSGLQMPYMFALHLGDLSSGTGVTGNQLKAQLMKNTLKQLAPGVLEEEVITHDQDRNPTSGKTRLGYSESVLRFTRLSSSQIYLQAATVSYRNDGRFQNKVILYGTLNRGASQSQPAYTSFPLGVGTGASGGASAVQQIMQQMLRQMNNGAGQ